MEPSAERKTQPISILSQPGVARLTVIAGALPAGLSFTLGGSEHVAGSANADIDLSMDASVAPRHALFRYADGGLMVSDEAGAGVFVKSGESTPLSDGSLFRVAGQVLRVRRINDDQEYTWQDGTKLFTSPRRKGTFCVEQILAGGQVGASASARDGAVTIGGIGSALVVTHDPAVSARHARVYEEGGQIYVSDAGSSNGTSVAIDAPTALHDGDTLWVGQQLLRVDFT